MDGVGTANSIRTVPKRDDNTELFRRFDCWQQVAVSGHEDGFLDLPGRCKLDHVNSQHDIDPLLNEDGFALCVFTALRQRSQTQLKTVQSGERTENFCLLESLSRSSSVGGLLWYGGQW